MRVVSCVVGREDRVTWVVPGSYGFLSRVGDATQCRLRASYGFDEGLVHVFFLVVDPGVSKRLGEGRGAARVKFVSAYVEGLRAVGSMVYMRHRFVAIT